MMYASVGTDIMLGMPPGMHMAWSRKLPCPPWAWSAMLSSWIFLYSGVSGASCAGPKGLYGSNLIDWPPRRGLTVSHWPLQLGYFASAACAPLTIAVDAVPISAAASAATPVELPYDMIILPALPG